MYKLQPHFNIDGTRKSESVSVVNLETTTFIPFDPANTCYQTFKKEVLAGAELLDADGNVMTQEQANELIKELP